MAQSRPAEGLVTFIVPEAGKICRTWYRVIGDLSNGRRPLVALQAGPGFRCDYLFPIMENLNTNYGTNVILFDQVGCGRSTHIPEKMGDTEFWSAQLFIDELSNLLENLRVNSYDLYGHSFWGGMLAASFASRRPDGLHRLILSNTPASIPLLMASTKRLLAQLPQHMYEALSRPESDQRNNPKEWRRASVAFYERHLCRVKPIPEVLQRTMGEWLEADPTVYTTITTSSSARYGPKQVTSTGSIKNWSTAKVVHQIDAPTLLINGQFEEVQDACVAPFFDDIPRVKWVTMENTSHMPMFENRDRYTQLIGEFLGV